MSYGDNPPRWGLPQASSQELQLADQHDFEHIVRFYQSINRPLPFTSRQVLDDINTIFFPEGMPCEFDDRGAINHHTSACTMLTFTEELLALAERGDWLATYMNFKSRTWYSGDVGSSHYHVFEEYLEQHEHNDIRHPELFELGLEFYLLEEHPQRFELRLLWSQLQTLQWWRDTDWNFPTHFLGLTIEIIANHWAWHNRQHPKGASAKPSEFLVAAHVA